MKTGTLLYALLKGRLKGKDEFGNRYYRGTGKKLHGQERRWVLYKGKDEASKVPPEWDAWLHHTVEEPLCESAAAAKPWQKNRLPNLSGTEGAYVPPGHDSRGAKQGPSPNDIHCWDPEQAVS